jgi:transcription initiation factor TFIID subunit 5
MDRTAKLWHLEYTFPLRVYAGHEKDVDVVRFHPNCNYLATAGADKTVRLWSHADAKMVLTCLRSLKDPLIRFKFFGFSDLGSNPASITKILIQF